LASQVHEIEKRVKVSWGRKERICKKRPLRKRLKPKGVLTKFGVPSRGGERTSRKEGPVLKKNQRGRHTWESVPETWSETLKSPGRRTLKKKGCGRGATMFMGCLLKKKPECKDEFKGGKNKQPDGGGMRDTKTCAPVTMWPSRTWI